MNLSCYPRAGVKKAPAYVGLGLGRCKLQRHWWRGIWSLVCGWHLLEILREKKNTNTWVTPAFNRLLEKRCAYKRREVSRVLKNKQINSKVVCAGGCFKTLFQKGNVHIGRWAERSKKTMTENYWLDLASSESSFDVVIG